MANGTIGDQEAAVVAYCTKSGHGTRLIPGTALNAVQARNFHYFTPCHSSDLIPTRSS